MIVADGMGGMAAGEVASRLAITTALKLVNKSAKWGFKINRKEARELFDRISDYLREIDRTFTQEGDADPRLFGMGTTLTAAYSIGVDLFVIHLGDSRAYLFREGELQQLTKDHTYAQAMADAGYIAHRRGPPPCPATYAHELPRGPPWQVQGRPPLALPGRWRPAPALHRRTQRHGR